MRFIMLRNSFRVLVNFGETLFNGTYFCLENCSEVLFSKFSLSLAGTNKRNKTVYPRFFHRKIALQFSIAVVSCLAGNSFFVNGLRYEFRKGPSDIENLKGLEGSKFLEICRHTVIP